MSLLENTYQLIKRQKISLSSTVLVVGVSGGADSLALLHILHQLAPRLGCQLHAATLDHSLRGAAGADDVRFVIETCHAWNIPVSSGQVDVPSLARQQQIGIEAAARSARYRFLAQIAHQQNASYVAVAHHADDQIETILMHLVRGSGLQGLSGMRVVMPLPDDPTLKLLRPFLRAPREEIETYCHQHQLAARQDATNEDTTYTRNYLRWQTLPHLRKLNPNVDKALLQLADIASVEGDYIQQQLNQVIADFVTLNPPRILIERAKFRVLHPALQRRFLYWAAHQLGSEDTGYQHVIAAAA
ncbi:MAG: tRNA lysidine(34) synthetase TilS, partial [Anaerolineae bacterium]|nr:tRNA lysidine(34) synthetase TilS [Anaerolineae bacterium]